MNFRQGQKVRLRAIEPQDAAFFARWNRDSERARLLDFLWPPTSLTEVQAWVEIQSRRKLENDAFDWVIENNAGAPVGTIGTHDCNLRVGTFSYSVDVAPEERGLGYASESIRLVLRYYFEELRYQKVTVVIHADNPTSIRLHEKLGFQKEGTLRRMIFTHGEYVDALWFGLPREEFEEMVNSEPA